MDKGTPIVVVAFDRPKSLRRVLKSLSEASYELQDIDLIISIDHAPHNQEVLEVANSFDWKFGEKIVKYAKTNLGLRKHIINCASLAIEYGSVIILEDDLYVSPNFYSYSTQALSFAEERQEIGGVSLYNHRTNVHKSRNFEPTYDSYDNWYFQFASSWGQAWTKNQVADFLEWYEQTPNISNTKSIPKNVRAWSDKSWLKYFIAFLIEKDKYFIYPKVSLTTNFSDKGTHVGVDSTAFQVPLLTVSKKKYKFSELSDSKCVYNAFFENQHLHNYLNIEKEDLSTDLYGYRDQYDTRYVLTSSILDYKMIKQFGRSLKPHENNIIFDIEGNDFFLYDTLEKVINPAVKNRFREITYQIKHLNLSDAKYLFQNLLQQRIKGILSKIFG